MNRYSKRINPSQRPQIDKLKNNMRFSSTPFDGIGYPFKQALAELRKEGLPIIFDKQKQRYYNKNTIDHTLWGYNN